MEHIKCRAEGTVWVHETAPINNFLDCVANIKASVCIANDIEAANGSYFEDLRPASNMDNHAVTGKLFDTTWL